MKEKKKDEKTLIEDDPINQIYQETVKELSAKKEDKVPIINFDEIMSKINKEYDDVMKDLRDHVVIIDDKPTPVIHTGNPCKDVYIGGGIPQRRMSYVWGISGTGKTTFAFQTASTLFKHSVYKGEPEKWKFWHLDSEEGESKQWLNRIGLKLPYKVLPPETIEDIGDVLLKINKRFPDHENFIIWDSVMGSSPKSITGRGDVARAVSSMMRQVKFNELNITMITINQHREKTDQYAQPEPPGGNHLKHKSHLTLFASSHAKSKFFKNPKQGRTVHWKIQKSRDSFVDVDYRLEMTYMSGFDSILPMIDFLRTSDVCKRRGDIYKFVVPDELEIKTPTVKDVVDDEPMNFIVKDHIDCNFNELKFDGFKDVYNFLLSSESYNYWRLGLKMLAYQSFKGYFMGNTDKADIYVKNLVDEIDLFYFKSNLFDKLIPGKIEFV